MSDQYMSFWDAVAVAQEYIVAQDTVRALDAIAAARNIASRGDKEFFQQREVLLEALAQAVDPAQQFPVDALPSDATNPQRIMVSGIGRSGTTLIYQQLAKLLLLETNKVNFRYEPYLWNIQSSGTKGNPFDMSKLHQFGLMVHTRAPLFISDSHPEHDPFIDHLFNEPLDTDPQKQPDAYLTKVIRASGRLRSYLKRYPDLRIVACLRNPIDTINSSLGMFSFFGEEFHADDRPRFHAELAGRGIDAPQLGDADLSVEWYAHWWRIFTEETLAVARDYPENVFVFCYEAFQEASDVMLNNLMEFVGIENKGMFMGLSNPAGPTIKSTSLTQHDINILKPQIEYYKDTVLVPRLGAENANSRTDKTLMRYLGGRFSFPLAGSDLGKKSPIQLRGMMLNGASSPFFQLAKRPAHPLSLPAMISQHYSGNPADLYRPAENPEKIKSGKQFGAIITCHNNAKTITEAVLSCLNQTLPFDEIIIIDDRSTDESAQILAELEVRYSSVRVLTLPSNLGPSGARDLGIRELSTEFFTQLDGDDLFWPSKNEQEATAINGDEEVVAFSDILLVRPEKSFVQSVIKYDAQSGTQAYTSLMSRTPQIPRDMTLSRSLYFKAGGYDMNQHLYEDWDFKLRLAAHSKLWKRAEGAAGTLYNRLTPGLSGVEDALHARALSQIFLSNLGLAPIPKKKILSAFDDMIGRFAERHISAQSRRALEKYLESNRDLTFLAEQVSRREMRTKENQNYADAIIACSTLPVREKAKA